MATNKRKPVPSHLMPLRKGDAILITVPNYWGKGATLRQAKSALRGAGGVLDGQWKVLSVHNDTYVNDTGDIMAPKHHAPLVIAQHVFTVQP